MRTRNDIEYAFTYAKGDGVLLLKELCQTELPNRDAPGLSINRPTQRNHNLVVTHVSGPERQVAAYVRNAVEADSCTAMYSHMLLQIFEAKRVGDGMLEAKLVKNLYAGD